MVSTASTSSTEESSPTFSLSSVVEGIKNLLSELFPKSSPEEIDHVIAKSKFNALESYKILFEKYSPPVVNQPSVSTQNNIIPNQQLMSSIATPNIYSTQQYPQQLMSNVSLPSDQLMNQSQFLSYGNSHQQASFQQAQQPMYCYVNNGMGQGYYVAIDPSQMSNSMMSMPSGMDATALNSLQNPTKIGQSQQTTQPPQPVNSKTNQLQQPVNTQYATIDKKKKCKDWDRCTQTSDQTHVEKYFHPCRNGANCKNIENAIHQNRFIHPCKDGKNCKKKDESHSIMFTHK